MKEPLKRLLKLLLWVIVGATAAIFMLLVPAMAIIFTIRYIVTGDEDGVWVFCHVEWLVKVHHKIEMKLL